MLTPLFNNLIRVVNTAQHLTCPISQLKASWTKPLFSASPSKKRPRVRLTVLLTSSCLIFHLLSGERMKSSIDFSVALVSSPDHSILKYVFRVWDSSEKTLQSKNDRVLLLSFCRFVLKPEFGELSVNLLDYSGCIILLSSSSHSRYLVSGILATSEVSFWSISLKRRIRKLRSYGQS